MRAFRRFLAILLCGLGATGLPGCGGPAASPSTEPAAAAPQRDSAAAVRAGAESLERDGQPFDLWKGRDGAKATVVIFTATECPISNRYAPKVRALCELSKQGIDFFLVYVDPDESAEDVRHHLEEYQYTCPGLRDPSRKFAKACGASVTPEAFVFDSQRKIVYQGRIDDRFDRYGDERTEPSSRDLADALAAVVEGRPVMHPVTEAVGCYIGDLE